MRPDAYSHPLHGFVAYAVGCLALFAGFVIWNGWPL